ncbi:MAG: TolC family protein [Campylobacterota bacterium]
MHFLKSNRFLTLLLLSTGFLYAQDYSTLEESILSENREKSFQYEQDKARQDSSKLEKDWINPVTLQYQKNLGETYQGETSSISVNQPIFKSGGIYEAIKYANATHTYSKLEIKSQRKELIKQAISYLFNIEKLNLNIKKAQYSVKNAQIDVKRKREQVLNGFLDGSFLDEALLKLNESKHNLVDLKYQKQELINSFHNISSKHYSKFELPTFTILSKKDFLNKNINLQKANKNIKKERHLKNMTISNYLPTINFYYNYSKTHFTDGNPKAAQTNSQTYGLSVSIPLDIKMLNTIESQKISYLKTKLDLKNKKDDEISFYKTKLARIDSLNQRIKISYDDIKLYDDILSIVKEETKAELKTQSDYNTLANSRKITALDLQLYKLDKQIILLDLYSKLN